VAITVTRASWAVRNEAPQVSAATAPLSTASGEAQ
jgi:hypothetical protein